jgi:putative intracellular protease/amidase
MASRSRRFSHAALSGPIVVAVALGSSGTVGSDVLAPYEVFASSPEFSVYTIAAGPGPAPIDGGPAIVPTYTFNDVRSGRARQPDVVVVPAVGAPEGPEETAMREWILEESGRGAQITGVCNGSNVLAATGILDGHKATGHWSRLSSLKKSRPQVQWTEGPRYVQDGLITTTAGVTSGIPGALPSGPRPRSDEAVAVLTAREREILSAITGGLTNTEIGEQMFVAESTVKTHVGCILMKLGLRDRVHAVIFAYENGLNGHHRSQPD